MKLRDFTQVKLFFTALMFFTRLPCPSWVDHDPEYLNRSSRYFPLVGLIVGAIAAIVFGLSQWLFVPFIAILLSMASTVWATGAFHEDGFADVCDGFGGGWTKTQTLTIMKDSRIGTYGSVGLGLLMSLKFFALTTIHLHALPFVLIAGHGVSRFVAVTLIYTHEYAQEDAQSKVKPLANRMSRFELIIAAACGLAPLLGLGLGMGLWRGVLLVPVLFAVRWWLARTYVKRLGGYTGDCLGATQQFVEVVFYLGFGSQLWDKVSLSWISF